MSTTPTASGFSPPSIRPPPALWPACASRVPRIGHRDSSRWSSPQLTAGWPTRRIEAVLAASALTAPESIEAELFEEILEPFVRVMGEDWFTSPSQVPPPPWPHGPVVEPPSSFPENGLSP